MVGAQPLHGPVVAGYPPVASVDSMVVNLQNGGFWPDAQHLHRRYRSFVGPVPVQVAATEVETTAEATQTTRSTGRR